MSPIQIPIEALTSRFGDRFNSLRSQSLGSRFANLRPVSEFLDFKRISKPANFGEVQSRVNYNLSYFSSNYAAVFVMLSIYSLLTNPVLLFVIIFVSAGLWGIGKLDGRDLDLGFARFNTSQLYTGLLLVGIPLGFWASPISTALWLIGATGVTVFGHAAFMDKPIENAFSEEAV
ncbi:prenylated rab acceptor PRA1 [Aspergillus heterothallicus]